LDALRYQPVSEELWIQHLRTEHREVLAMGKGGIREVRLEDYVVGGLIDFNDISYDDHADLLYDLAGQTVRHFQSYLEEDDIAKVLQCHQREIARFIHAQMQEHFWEEEGELEVKVSCGFTDLRQSAYAQLAAEPTADYRVSPTDKSNMSKYLFGGFSRCLFSAQKFASEPERRMAVILERDALKWFKPAKGQFQIFYRQGTTPMEYQPDFVAETENTIYMLEPKASNQMSDSVVLAKKESALKWCAHASDYAASHGGKPWVYALIPHDEIAVNMTLEVLAKRFAG
jgi:type III restriction enzyme